MPLTFEWDPGGPGYGVGLDGPTPVYTYTDAGLFTATVTARNICGLTDTDSHAVEVLCYEPQVSFTDNSPVMLGEPMLFTSTVTGTGPFTYTWDFGDGLGSSAEAGPVYTYTQAGEYIVTLTVEGPCGQDSMTATVSVELPVHYSYLYLPLIIKEVAP